MNTQHTFVIPAYKESRYLEECIAALKNQKSKSAIIISTSTPSPFLENVSSRHNIPLVVHPRTGGLATDWTNAYKTCQTPYLTLAHQDDLYFPDYTQLCLEAVRKYPDALIIFTDYMEKVGENYRSHNLLLSVKRLLLLPCLVRRRLSSRWGRKMILALGSPVCCPSVMFNREKIGCLEFDNSFLVNPDWDAWLRLAEREGSFVHINKRLMAHRIHKGSETAKGIQNNRRQMEDVMLFEKIWPPPIARLLACIYSVGYKSSVEKES